MTWGSKEINYAISQTFSEKQMRGWPGLELVREDGRVALMGEDGNYYVLVLHRASKTLAKFPLTISITLPVKEAYLLMVEKLEAFLDEFWKEKEPGWPGLGPAGGGKQ